jgi:hypothetical protein
MQNRFAWSAPSFSATSLYAEYCLLSKALQFLRNPAQYKIFQDRTARKSGSEFCLVHARYSSMPQSSAIYRVPFRDDQGEVTTRPMAGSSYFTPAGNTLR